MSLEWKRQPIAALAHHNLGKMLDRAKNRGELKPYLRNLNVRWFDFDLTDVLQMRFEADEGGRYTVRKGDLVICEGGYPGRAAVWDDDEPVYFQKALHRVRFHEPAYARWCLYYLLYQDAFGQLRAHFNGAGIQHFTGEALAKFEIPVPTIDVVTRIVGILDEAFESIASAKANAEKNLRNARELFESRREAVLSSDGQSWGEAAVCDLCDIKHGYAFEGEFFATDGDYVLLTPGNFFESGGYRDRGEKQKYFTGHIPSDYVLSEGSLLVAMTEQAAGLLGSPLLVPESDRFLHNQRLGLVVGKAGVTWVNEFFFHVFNLARVRAEIHASASGVKVRHTSPSKIGAVRVAFPGTVAEQREVATKLRQVAEVCDQLVAVYENKLAALDELKNSLLHQAFSGAL